MSNKWTNEQLAAITSRNSNLLVAAAAGSGKTAVLVERIIQRILDEKNPVDVDRLLVVTFTKAAATEMKERVNTALSKALTENPDSHHLKRQLSLLNRAFITTLHSFCLEVLHQFFYKIDLDPNFRIADEGEISLIKADVLEDLFERHYAEDDEHFLALADAYGGTKDDLKLQEMVLRLWEFSKSTPNPESWLKSMVTAYIIEENPTLENTEWGHVILEYIEIVLQAARESIEQGIALARSPGGPLVYSDTLEKDLVLVQDLTLAKDSWNGLYNAFLELSFSRLNPCRDKDVDDVLLNRVKGLRDEIKSNLTHLQKTYFRRSPKELISDIKIVQPYVQTLIDLVLEFEHEYNEAKRQKSLVDFSDLEHLCLQILATGFEKDKAIVPSDASYILREQFLEVYTDEFQDINGVQETILHLVSGESDEIYNRFMVGDVKQSIYGFRLADPSLFRAKYQSYVTNESSPIRRIDLRRNFRSSLGVIRAVNYVFKQIMASKTGQGDYTSEAELIFGLGSVTEEEAKDTLLSPVEVHLIDKETSLSDDFGENNEETTDMALQDEFDELDTMQREARLIAQRIKGFLDTEGSGATLVFDKNTKQMRPIRYRDIVVLLRSTRNTANVLIEEFRNWGIPAYAELGNGYFEAIEVEIVMSLLKIIDNPRQDIPLAAVLRSPILSLNEQDLAEIRLRDTTEEFYDAVKAAAQLAETPVEQKLATFLERLERWRTLAHRSSLAELIWTVYKETGYYNFVGGMPGGAQRQANLRALYDRARQYENSSFRGLFRFLRFIERFREEGNDLGNPGAIGENEDVVRVISIHKSKGLEFPVVFVAGLGRQFNNADTKETAVFHKGLGIGLPVVDLEKHITYPTFAQQAVKLRITLDMLAEEMRILYVALTRARDRLILVGSLRSLQKSAKKWVQTLGQKDWPLTDGFLMSCRAYIDWLGPAIVRHKDGTPIRRIAGLQEENDKMDDAVYRDSSSWDIHFYTTGDSVFQFNHSTPNEEKYLNHVRELHPINVTNAHIDEIKRRLSWRYPHESVVGKHAKTTVSEMKRRFMEQDDQQTAEVIRFKPVFNRPRFIVQSNGLTPTEYGSAVHLVLQHLDFSSADSLDKIRQQLSQMVINELLTEEQHAAIVSESVFIFTNSPLGKSIRQAQRVYRELPFTLLVPAGQAYPELGENDEQVMLQGVIDCLFEKEDGFVLVDYKTDMVDDHSLHSSVERYLEQLRYYQMAIEKLFKKPVREKYLYYFSIGKAVQV